MVNEAKESSREEECERLQVANAWEEEKLQREANEGSRHFRMGSSVVKDAGGQVFLLELEEQKKGIHVTDTHTRHQAVRNPDSSGPAAGPTFSEMYSITPGATTFKKKSPDASRWSAMRPSVRSKAFDARQGPPMDPRYEAVEDTSIGFWEALAF